MDTKQAILAALAIVALILLFAGMGTHAVVSPSTTSKTVTTSGGYGAFWTCSTSQVGDGEKITTCSDADSKCKEQEDVRKAYGGFGILTCIFTGIVCIFSIAKAFDTGINQGIMKWVNLGLLIAAVVCGLIAWATAFAYGTSKFCGSVLTDSPNLKIGPAAPLILVAWICLCVQLVLEFVFGSGGSSGGGSDKVDA